MKDSCKSYDSFAKLLKVLSIVAILTSSGVSGDAEEKLEII